MKVFVDTNVLLDVLAQRGDFYLPALQIWNLAESGRIEASIAAISFSNCYYIIRRYAGGKQAEKAVRLLRDIFTPVDLTSQILQQAIDAGFKDFEDAIQYYSAIHARAECLLTRNPDHFPRQSLAILGPQEFLATHSFD